MSDPLSSSSPSPSPSSSPSTSSAAKGVLYAILLRLLSFSLSQITIRLIHDPRTLGYSSVQLELLCSSTILFLSREGFRLSLVRVKSSSSTTTAKSACDEQNNNVKKKVEKSSTNNTKEEEGNAVNNVAWLTIPFGIVLTIISLFYHLHNSNNDTNDNNDNNSGSKSEINKNHHFDYKIAGIYYCIATIIETTSEPCVIHCLQTFNLALRAKAEGIASIGKALTTVILLSMLQNQGETRGEEGEEPGFLSWSYNLIGPVSTFGIAQIVYAMILSTVLYKETKHDLYIPKLRYIQQSKLLSLFHIPTLKLSIIFTVQSVFKHLLTEGDRIILTSLVSSYNSGIYALVSTYGSIVSRMVLLPMEDNGRLLFSHYHGEITATVTEINQYNNCDNDNNNDKDEKLIHQKNHQEKLSKSVQQIETTYITLVKLVLYIGSFFIAFGSNYTSTLLNILAGSKWGNNHQASYTLSIYCSYILCMALNGMTEAFVYGVVDGSTEVGLLSIMHISVGFVFYLLAPWLVLRQNSDSSNGNSNGTVGLIVANQICMILRSLYSMDFAAHYFDQKKQTQAQKQTNGPMSQGEKDQHGEKISSLSFIMSLFTLSNITKRFALFYHLFVQVLPKRSVLVCFAISYKGTRLSKDYFWETNNHQAVALISMETLMHVSVGVSLLLITFFMIYKCEREFGQVLKSMVVTKKKQSVPTTESTSTCTSNKEKSD